MTSTATASGEGAVAPSAKAALREIDALVRARQTDQAEQSAAHLAAQFPNDAEVLAMQARIAQALGKLVDADAFVSRAYALAPLRVDIRLMRVAAHIYCGRIAEARALALSTPAIEARELLLRFTRLLAELNEHEEAYRVPQAAATKAPGDLSLQAALAGAAMALGRIDEAEAIAERLIAARPDMGEISYNRATLRKQTEANNHLAQLEQIAASKEPSPDPALLYAIGKEHEDLGKLEAAFGWYARGAAARRKRLSYTIETDERVMSMLACTFDQTWFDRTPSGRSQGAPVFVLGLPRTGTTLVERILSSHSCIGSVGEVNDLAYAVTRHGRTREKNDLAAAAAAADMHQIGEEYWRALRGYGLDQPLLIDKTPVNYLYLGLIAKALPNARIVHLKRHPMGAGYAMFKTYFRMGYPFSYDLEDIGRYIVAYARLMRHWRALFGSRIIDVAYEDVVADIEGQTRRLLEACGVAWEAACLAFHTNRAPSTTASASQVRQPLYAGSVEQWRNHEDRLEPLARILKQGGLL